MSSLPSHVIQFDLEKRTTQKVSLENPLDFSNANVIYWVHINSLNLEIISKQLKTLGLWTSAFEAIAKLEQKAQVLDDEDSLAIVLHDWKPTKLILHLTSRVCITLANEEFFALQKLATTYSREFKYAQTTGFILFLLFDYLLEDFTEKLSHLDEESEDIDDQLYKNFQDPLSFKILSLKRRILTFRHVVVGVRDILLKISGRKISVISEACRQSLMEISHHAQVIVTELETLRDLVTSSLDAYNTVLSKRMNETMKILTIFSAIILPMSLIAGIYGMNFELMPELKWKIGYPFALSLMTLCGISLVFFFKKKKWF